MKTTDLRFDVLLRSACSLLLFGCVSATMPPAALAPAKAAAPAAAATAPAPSFATLVDRDLDTPTLKTALWAALIEDDAGNVLYARNAHTLVMPASNRKLFSAATVANCLGVGTTLKTELWLEGKDLVLHGGGDPSFGGRYVYDRDALFAPVVAALRARGTTSIDGDLVADVSAFDRQTLPPSWKVGYVGSNYAVPVDALAYNENVIGVVVEDRDCLHPIVMTDPSFIPASVVGLTCGAEGEEPDYIAAADNSVVVSGSVARSDAAHVSELVGIHDPALYAAQALRDALLHAGIRVRGGIRVRTEARAGAPREAIATLESQPLFELLAIELKPSQNHYAEMLFKDVSLGSGGPASYRASLAREREFLTGEAGVAAGEFRFADGCGLSTEDLVTPAAVVTLLRWMNAPERRGIFHSILATPAEEGTLRRRLTELAPRLRGKTGTISGVAALSGILRGNDGRDRYFSLIVNHSAAAGSDATKAIDAVVRELAKY